jgi:hypothetical protein
MNDPAAQPLAGQGADEDAREEALEGEIVEEAGAFSGEDPSWAAAAGQARDERAFGNRTVAAAAVPRRGGAGLTFGVVLVVIGGMLIAQQFSDALDAAGWPFVLGLALLAWWGFRGTFGVLLLAGVLTGLGVGLAVHEVVDVVRPVALGLGAGFVAIFVLDRLRQGNPRWWLLVPGVALLIVGLLGQSSWWDALGGSGWPLLLVLVGLVIVGAALGRRHPADGRRGR